MMGEPITITLEMVGWFASILSIAGALLNAWQNRWGFVLWIFSNTVWMIWAIYMEVWSMIPMYALFTAISFIGMWKWSRAKYRLEAI
jgi:hypothetical protein